MPARTRRPSTASKPGGKKPFMIEIQPKVLPKSESRTFMRLLRKYIEATGVPPAFQSSSPRPSPSPSPSPSPTPGGTLSNCKDTDTECSCEVDDSAEPTPTPLPPNS